MAYTLTNSTIEHVSSKVIFLEKQFLWTIPYYEGLLIAGYILEEPDYEFVVRNHHIFTKWILKVRRYKSIRGTSLAQLNCVQSSKNLRANFSLFLRITDKNGGRVLDELKIGPTSLNPWKGKDGEIGRESSLMTRRDENTPEPIVDGSIQVHGHLKMYALQSPRPLLEERVQDFEILSRHRLTSQQKMLTFSDTMVKILSNNGKDFYVSKEMLCVRCPNFATMLNTEMVEGNTGVITLKELSTDTVNVLLRYLLFGCLHDDWKKETVLEELVCAAHMYELHDLVQFLDENMGYLCNSENMKRLALLAKTRDMKVATRDVLRYVQETTSSLEDLEFILNAGCDVMQMTSRGLIIPDLPPILNSKED